MQLDTQEIQLLLLNLCKTLFSFVWHCWINELHELTFFWRRVKLMNAYDTTCFSHFLDTLIHFKTTIIDDHHVFREEDEEKCGLNWVSLLKWKRNIQNRVLESKKLFQKSSQEQQTRVKMKKSRHAVLPQNFSCVALMSLYNNHCFISSTKN